MPRVAKPAACGVTGSSKRLRCFSVLCIAAISSSHILIAGGVGIDMTIGFLVGLTI